jgi:hypothetical protein
MSHRKHPMEESRKPNQVVVTVDASNNVICDPETVPALGRNIELKFVLKTDGYVFPNDGTAVVVDNPGTEFPRPSKALPPDDRTAMLFNCNSKAGTFKYTATVWPIGGGTPLSVDPSIQNGP